MTLESRLKGVEVELHTVEGHVRGIVKDVVLTLGYASLEHVQYIDLIDVWDQTAGHNVYGCQHYEASDIIRFDRVHWRQELMPSQLLPQVSDNGAQSGENFPSDGLELIVKQTVSYVILDSIGVEEFFVALRNIRQQPSIGLALTGSNLGRKGHLSWFQIATKHVVYLFDMTVLGKSAFRHGLADICSSAVIVKVMHDCRNAADMLKHLYEVELVNVFDTLVADLMVEGEKKLNIEDRWPTVVKTLTMLMNVHLHKNFFTSTLALDDAFTLRPPMDLHLQALVEAVFDLLKLKSVLKEKMSKDFRCGIEVFLLSARDKDDEAWATTPCPEVQLPQNFDGKILGVKSSPNVISTTETGGTALQPFILKKLDGSQLKNQLEIFRIREYFSNKSHHVNPKLTQRKYHFKYNMHELDDIPVGFQRKDNVDDLPLLEPTVSEQELPFIEQISSSSVPIPAPKVQPILPFSFRSLPSIEPISSNPKFEASEGCSRIDQFTTVEADICPPLHRMSSEEPCHMVQAHHSNIFLDNVSPKKAESPKTWNGDIPPRKCKKLKSMPLMVTSKHKHSREGLEKSPTVPKDAQAIFPSPAMQFYEIHDIQDHSPPQTFPQIEFSPESQKLFPLLNNEQEASNHNVVLAEEDASKTISNLNHSQAHMFGIWLDQTFRNCKRIKLDKVRSRWIRKVTLSDLPLLPWRDILSHLSINDKLSLFSIITPGPSLDAYHESWKRFRMIVRPFGRFHNKPQLRDFVLMLPRDPDSKVMWVVQEINTEELQLCGYQVQPLEDLQCTGPLHSCVANVEEFSMYIFEPIKSLQLFANLLDSLDVSRLKSFNLCLAGVKQESSLRLVGDCIMKLEANCREICITRWPTALRGGEQRNEQSMEQDRDLETGNSWSLILSALMNPNLTKLQRLCLGWFDYADPEYWAIEYWNYMFIRYYSQLNQANREKVLITAVQHYKSLKELAIGHGCSSNLLQILADREREPLKRLDMMIVSGMGLDGTSAMRRDNGREDAWKALMETNKDLEIHVTIEDMHNELEELPIVHSIHFLPVATITDAKLHIIRNRFSETLVALSLHQEKRHSENIRETCLQLVLACKNLTTLVYASSFNGNFARSLFRAKTTRWKKLTLFEDKLLEGPEDPAQIMVLGTELLQRPWRLNEASKRLAGPRSYCG